MSNHNNSAVLDVTVESKEISSILKENNDHGSVSENSVFQSGSLESFSTFQDVENLSELHVDENSDLCVHVDNPQKVLDTLETYITFRITTKVARIEFEENEYIVRRRYNDFVWLRQRLIESHPFCIVPPLPTKHTIMGQLDRYSKEFILVRMKALNVFLSRIVQHPILSCNEHFKVFLTAKQGQFSLHRKQKRSEHRTHSPSHSVSSYSLLKNRHMEFDKAKAYLSTLYEKLTSIEKISSRINKERQDLVHELNNFYPIFNIWALSEPHLAPYLKGIAHAIESSTLAQSNLIFSYSTSLGNPVKEFLIYVSVVQDTLKKREAYQCVYENSLTELTKRHTEKDQLLAQGSSSPQGSSGFSLFKQPTNDDKLEKLGSYIPQLVKKVEINQDRLECANECLRSDLERWHGEKQKILKDILLEFVNKQIECYMASVSAWEHIASELMSKGDICNTKK